jgi:hypothetical protein
MKTALNTAERILLKVPTSDGYEWLDPRLVRGATYQDVADEATAYDAICIIRFDEDTLTGEDITDDVAKYSDIDPTDNPPLWLKNASNFEAIRYEAIADAAGHARHERSFRPAA